MAGAKPSLFQRSCPLENRSCAHGGSATAVMAVIAGALALDVAALLGLAECRPVEVVENARAHIHSDCAGRCLGASDKKTIAHRPPTAAAGRKTTHAETTHAECNVYGTCRDFGACQPRRFELTRGNSPHPYHSLTPRLQELRRGTPLALSCLVGYTHGAHAHLAPWQAKAIKANGKWMRVLE